MIQVDYHCRRNQDTPIAIERQDNQRPKDMKMRLDPPTGQVDKERGHQHLFLTVDDPDLAPKLLQIMETLVSEADSVREGIARTVVGNLKVMARMGTILEDLVRRQYPEFPIQVGVRSWEDYLPPLSETLVQLAERYDSSDAAMAATR